MKTKVFFVLCMLTAAFTFGQNPMAVQKNEVFKSQEIKSAEPKFTWNKKANRELPGSNYLLINSYLSENVGYPAKALEYSIQGTEVVRFTVTTSGEVTNFKIINSVCPEIDEETIRALSNTNGMWIPGFKNGKPEEMEKEIAMVFQIYNNKKGTAGNMAEQATALFEMGSKALIFKNNPGKALKYFDRALTYLPYDSNILYLRGMVRTMLDDHEGAKADWDRMKLIEVKSESINSITLITVNSGKLN